MVLVAFSCSDATRYYLLLLQLSIVFKLFRQKIRKCVGLQRPTCNIWLEWTMTFFAARAQHEIFVYREQWLSSRYHYDNAVKRLFRRFQIMIVFHLTHATNSIRWLLCNCYTGIWYQIRLVFFHKGFFKNFLLEVFIVPSEFKFMRWVFIKWRKWERIPASTWIILNYIDSTIHYSRFNAMSMIIFVYSKLFIKNLNSG